MKWIVFWTLLVFTENYHYVDSKIVYKSFKATMNQNFIRANLSVGHVGDVSTLNASIDVLQTLNSKFFIQSTLSQLVQKKRRLLVATPRLHYCTALGFSSKIPIFSDVIKESLKFGNFPMTCPIEPMHYYMVNFFINDSTLPIKAIMQDKQQYLIQTWFWDEALKKSVLIFKFDNIFEYSFD